MQLRLYHKNKMQYHQNFIPKMNWQNPSKYLLLASFKKLCLAYHHMLWEELGTFSYWFFRHALSLASELTNHRARNVNLKTNISCVLYEVGVEKELFEKTDLESVVESTIAENFDPIVSQQCSEVILNYDRVWKMGDMTRRVTDAISLTEKNLERAIKQKISFQWLHEDVLGPC